MNEEVMKILGGNDPVQVTGELDEARIKAARSMSRPGGRNDESVKTFYELYFRYIAKPVLEHFVGEVQHSHETGAVYARVNEVFQVIYGRQISPTFEHAHSEDHLSGLYKGVSFDQADIVISKGPDQPIFSGRAIQYGYSTGLMGRIVILEKGTFEGIGGGEETERAKDDFSDLEEDGIFSGMNSLSRQGTTWAGDTASTKLFPGLTKTFTASPVFQERFLVFSDDPIGTRRILTPQLMEDMSGVKMSGNSCVIIERDRILLLRNRIDGLMEVDLESPMDLEKEIEKNFCEMQETVRLLDALREVSGIVAEENSSFEA